MIYPVVVVLRWWAKVLVLVCLSVWCLAVDAVAQTNPKQTKKPKSKGFVHKEEVQEEVIVTGYNKIDAHMFTGASASVKLSDIKLDGVADVSRMLEGRVAGLSIQNVTGTFGSAPRINIRGGGSILGNAQPLWVIDGAVYEGLAVLNPDELVSGDAVTLISSAIAGLNAADIEDVQVLKDASATSLYGSRALNGVIIVNTKSGKRNGENKFQYWGEWSVRPKPSYANFDLLNSQQTMAIYQELNNKGYFNIANTLYGRRSGVFYQMYKALSTVDPATGKYQLQNTPEARNAFLRDREFANTDWFAHLFTFRPIQNHTIAFQGGGKNTATYASIGYYRDGGWTIADQVQRLTTNLKTTFFVGRKFKISLLGQGNLRDQLAPGTFAQRKNVAVGAFERDFDINPFSYALSTSRTLRPTNEAGQREFYRNNWAPFNIDHEYENNYLNISVLDFRIQTQASYNILPGLEASLLVAARNAVTSIDHTIKDGSNVVAAFRAYENPLVARQNIYLVHDKDNPILQPQVGLTQGGIFAKNSTSLQHYLGRLSMDYRKAVNQHFVRVFGFFELRGANRSVNPFKGYGIKFDGGNQIFTNPLLFRKLLEEGENYFSLSHYADRGGTFSLSTTYGYDDKYIFHAVLNYEGSNSAGLGGGARFLPTWNTGVKWNVDREYFMRGSSVISALSLRTSFGLVAKSNENAYNSVAVFRNAIVNRFRFADRESVLQIAHLANRDLAWEKMYELNVGVDLAFYGGRIQVNTDVYQRNSFDLIDLIRTSGVGGQYYKYANFGDMRSRGLEVVVRTKNVEHQDWEWTSTLTFSMINQQITRLLNTPSTFDLVSGAGKGNLVGFPKNGLFSFNFQGLNGQGLPTFAFGLYPVGRQNHANVTAADFSDAQYSPTYLIFHGSVEPNVFGGVGNTVQYKNWSLSVFVSVQAGNKIRLNPSFDPAYGDLNVFSNTYEQRWEVPGDEYKTMVPAFPSQELIRLIGRENVEKAYNTYQYSQYRVVDGSFVRMKNISLSYTVPDRFLRMVKLKAAIVRLQITNPFLLYSDKRLHGQDPEFYRSGGVSLPTPKQYTLTFNLNI